MYKSTKSPREWDRNQMSGFHFMKEKLRFCEKNGSFHVMENAGNRRLLTKKWSK